MRILLATWYLPFSIVQLLVLLMLPRKRLQAYFERIDRAEHARRVDSLRAHFERGGIKTLLDVGSGSGVFGSRIGSALGASVTGTDVVDYDATLIPFARYDGRKLPFPEKAFDASLFSFVLHHTNNQSELLDEARRVSRRYIFLFEDTPANALEYLFICYNDYYSNILQGFVRWVKGLAPRDILKIPTPFRFRSIPEWEQLFADRGLRLVHADVRRMPHKPLSKSFFVVEVPA